jgi:hypothetical protein
MSIPASQGTLLFAEQCPACGNYDSGSQFCQLDTQELEMLLLAEVVGDEGAGTCAYFKHGQPAEIVIPVSGLPDVTEETAAQPVSPPPAEPAPISLQLSQMIQATLVDKPAAAEVTAAPPVRHIPMPPLNSEARIYCPKCKVENSSTATRCLSCDANLLPGESIRGRLITFGILILVSIGLVYLVYILYIKSSVPLPDLPFINPVVLSGAAVLAFFTAIFQALRRTPAHVKYENRSQQHVSLNLRQALADINQAMDLAPEKQQGKLLRQRAEIYEKMGLADEAARDRLTLITSPDAYKSEGDALAMLTGADADAYRASRRSGQIDTLLQAGKAKVVGYCPQCKQVIELNTDKRCLLHPKVKGRDVEYVIPADALAGKLVVMQKWESRQLQVAKQLTDLLAAGQARAVGYCPRCRAPAELDDQRYCSVHPKIKAREVQYVLPRDVYVAKQKLRQARLAGKASGRQIALVVVALIGIAYAALVLLDVNVAGWIGKFFSGLR